MGEEEEKVILKYGKLMTVHITKRKRGGGWKECVKNYRKSIL